MLQVQQLEAAFFPVDLGQVLDQGLDLEAEQLEVGPHLEAVFVDHLEAVCEQQFEADFDKECLEGDLEADF